jgi:hypothetical protein
MKLVNITQLKIQFAKYLNYIRTGLIIEKPLENNSLADLHFKPIPNKKIDSLKFLREERDDH